MKYDACAVPGISWSLGKRVYFYRFVFSLSFYRFRYRYTEIVSVQFFLSYRFQTIIPKLSVRYPFLLFSCPRFCPCIGSAQITPSTCKRESIVLCLQALEMIPIRQILNLALLSRGKEGHFFPSVLVLSDCLCYLTMCSVSIITKNKKTANQQKMKTFSFFLLFLLGQRATGCDYLPLPTQKRIINVFPAKEETNIKTLKYTKK